MSEFYLKYLKYKNKYFELKKMYGGLFPEKNLELLSELANYTRRIFITNEDIYQLIKTHVISDFITSEYVTVKSGFAQDPLIQLYNRIEKIYYNYINSIGWSDNIIISKKKYIPPHLRKPGIVQQEEEGDGILNKLHQDNVFKQLEYKNIKLDNNKELCHDVRNIDKYIECDYLDQIKGGNFISSPPTDFAPNGAIFYIKPITEEFKNILEQNVNQKIVPLNILFKFEKDNTIFRHIDEIMCFMPYGTNKFKVWFYDIIKTEGMDEEIYLNLKQEHLDNLNKISQALFNSDYGMNKDKFFIISIDVGYPNYIFPFPPIFNSTYIEYDPADIDKLKEIEPEREKYFNERNIPQLFISHSSSNPDSLNKDIVEELDKLKSFITDKPVKYHIIDTNKLHNIGLDIEYTYKSVPGGNLHCTIKQEFKKV